jgi:hypothetical protein
MNIPSYYVQCVNAGQLVNAMGGSIPVNFPKKYKINDRSIRGKEKIHARAVQRPCD